MNLFSMNYTRAHVKSSA